jgi:hypothetical protein
LYAEGGVEREDGEVERGGRFEGGEVSGEEGKCRMGGVCRVEEVGKEARGKIDLGWGVGVVLLRDRGEEVSEFRFERIYGCEDRWMLGIGVR